MSTSAGSSLQSVFINHDAGFVYSMSVQCAQSACQCSVHSQHDRCTKLESGLCQTSPSIIAFVVVCNVGGFVQGPSESPADHVSDHCDSQIASDMSCIFT